MTSSRWDALRSPVALFLAVGLLALVGVVVVTEVLGSRAARDEALADARSTTVVLAHSVAEPELTRGLVDGSSGAVDRFDRVALDRLVVDRVRRIKVWAADGTIVYSDDVRLIGERFPLEGEELDILRHGGSDAEVSDLSEPENRFERQGDGLVEVYTRVVSPEGQPLLFEAYYSVAGIEDRQAEVVAPFRRIILGALAVVVLIATAMLWVLNRRVRRAAAERERLLLGAADASEAERRRIARDLHDGVVQDLAGSAFALSALARDAPPPVRTTLLDTAGALRGSLRSLRSLLVEIHPPDLSAATLPAAVDDLVAAATAAGVAATVDVDVDVDGVEGVRDESVALLWRVCQEAVRNTLRHAGAGRLAVTVRRTGATVVLTVADDGVGFVPAEVSEHAHYGLRGLQSLVVDGGGRFSLTSAPGAGTTVRTEVPA